MEPNPIRKKRSIVLIILVGVLITAMTFGTIIPLGLYQLWRGSDLAKSTGALGGTGRGCFIGDSYFTDLSAVSDPNAVVSKITNRWKTARGNERYLLEVIERGKSEGINPLLALSIWLGEQTFQHPEKAFGYGYTDSGVRDGVSSWEAQLDGVYRSLRKTLDNKDPYAKPVGANRFTRLFYNYTTAMKTVYVNAGNSWNEEGKYSDGSQPVKIRLSLFREVAPNQVECQSGVLLAGASGDGTSTCPGVIPKYLTRDSALKSAQGVPRVIILHYLGYRGSSNTGEYLTANQAYNYFNGDRKHVQYVISREGAIYQFSPENRAAAGALNYNQPTGDYDSTAISISIENEGQFEDSRDELQETPAQVQANISLVSCLMKKYNIPLENLSVGIRNTAAKEPYNVISHKEADARGGADGGIRGSRRSDPGQRFMDKVIGGLK